MRKIKISKPEIVNYSYYHIIRAEGRAILRNSLIPLNASFEIGTRVALHDSEYLMYNPRINTLNQ